MRRSKRKPKTLRLFGAMASLAVVAAACSSSGTGHGNGAPRVARSEPTGQIYAENSSGTPRTGGTLTMLGVADVDYMDPNISYFPIGYLNLRMWSRQLYNYPAEHGQTTTVVPDLATAMPTISEGGKKYTVTIRAGAMWDLPGGRQVTAADVVLGVKRSCNPVQPFGGQADFESFLVGYQDFCSGFANVPLTTAAIKQYIDTHKISGVTVDPSNPLTVDFTLTHPVSYFDAILTLPPFAPAPAEYLDHLPASNDLAQHTISDGPYYVAGYDPGKSIVYKRNPYWKASADPIRKAYVNQIDVSETGTEQSIFQQILANTPKADMSWDTGVPPDSVPQLIAQHNRNLNLQSEYSTNPYVLFNTVSPNNSRALTKLGVRQAIMYALNRNQLVADAGGAQVSPPLAQILPPGVNGAAPAYDLYPYNPTKAKELLRAAGVSTLILKFLYRAGSQTSLKMFETIQADLGQIGITVSGLGVPIDAFYNRYLEVPSVARNGTWDLSLFSWAPDWYGDAAASFFSPLFDGRVLPPTSSNFGLFNDPNVSALIDQALDAPDAAAAARLWHETDVQVMTDAAIYPITDPNYPLLHGSRVHNCVYVAAIENCDPTIIWLSQ